MIMKKTIQIFLISTAICGFGATAFWYLSGMANDSRPNDILYLSDCFFLSGVSFFVVGMAIALFATSRGHYYRHLKNKWKNKIESDEEFEKSGKERKKKMWLGIAIALSGIVGFAVSGYIAMKIAS